MLHCSRASLAISTLGDMHLPQQLPPLAVSCRAMGGCHRAPLLCCVCEQCPVLFISSVNN
jgi:hypothetical protein